MYIVQGERFNDFVSKGFGQNANLKKGEFRFNNVDIFSSAWSGRFGYPFPKNNLGGNRDNFDIAGSFNCLNPSRAVNGLGRIRSIHADYI